MCMVFGRSQRTGLREAADSGFFFLQDSLIKLSLNNKIWAGTLFIIFITEYYEKRLIK